MNREQRRHLLYCAERYVSLGYSVGLTREKALIGEFHPRGSFASVRSQSVHIPKDQEWEGISIILNRLVCVDFDTEEYTCPEELPSTWKEKTRRGWHLFYRLPKGNFNSRVAFREGTDLLTKNPSKVAIGYLAQPIHDLGDHTWYGHALVSPTIGYKCIEGAWLRQSELPIAPKWILQALKE